MFFELELCQAFRKSSNIFISHGIQVDRMGFIIRSLFLCKQCNDGKYNSTHYSVRRHLNKLCVTGKLTESIQREV